MPPATRPAISTRLGIAVSDRPRSITRRWRARRRRDLGAAEDAPRARARSVELGIPVIRRAEALGEAVSGGDLVAIAGTHGKTTTTVMTTEALHAAGREPTGVVGGRVGRWGGNLRYGSDRLFVVEADEYDRSFLALTPTVAVITNVEADHLDIYADLADIRRTFETVRIAGAHDRAVRRRCRRKLARDAELRRKSFATGFIRVMRDLSRSTSVPKAEVRLFEVEFDDEVLGEVELAVPGMHNVLNALAAVASGLALGVTARGDASGPRIVRRRRAPLSATRLRERYRCRGRLRASPDGDSRDARGGTNGVSRPSYRRRLSTASLFAHARLRARVRRSARRGGLGVRRGYLSRARAADSGRDRGSHCRFDAQAGGSVAWQGARDSLSNELARSVRGGDVVLTIGAGDITKTGPELLRALGGSV